MSEAKPQDGSTVKGYRTLGEKDIANMNRLKEISRQFIAQLEYLKGGDADPRLLKRRCRKRACRRAGQWLSRMTTAENITRRICECA